MNYKLYPRTHPATMSGLYIEPPNNPLLSTLSISLDDIKQRYVQQSEGWYHNKLLRYYKNQHIIQEMREAGLTTFDLRRRECRHIARYLHRYEHIKAAVRGKLPNDGWGLLVATNLRIIFLHRVPPLFTNMDEVSYDLVSGVSYNQVGNLYASVTLHTRTKDYDLHFVNLDAGVKFAGFIEKMSVDREIMKTEVAEQLQTIRSLTRS